MSKIRVQHDQFETKVLEVSPGGLKAPKVFLEGVELKGKRMVFPAENDLGANVSVKLIGNVFGDLKVSIDGGTEMAMLPKLPWYAYIFGAMPLLLIVSGGAIGGAVGAGAGVINLGLFRTEHPLWLKIIGALVVTSIATVIYLVLAMLLHMAIN